MKIEEANTGIAYTQKGANVKVTDSFKKTYGKNPQNIAFTPYRVCPIGIHSDHFTSQYLITQVAFFFLQ